VLRAIKAQLVTKVQQVIKVLQEYKELQVQWVHKVQPGFRAQLANRDQWDCKDCLVKWDKLVHKGHKD
jgi:hypothetical protein